MKRSEMVEIIWKLVLSVESEKGYIDSEDCSNILKLVEDNGMKRPTVYTHEPTEYGFNFGAGKYIKSINQWEPENA